MSEDSKNGQNIIGLTFFHLFCCWFITVSYFQSSGDDDRNDGDADDTDDEREKRTACAVHRF